MTILRTALELKERVGGWHDQHIRIGLIPTMGFLHQGHLSLVDHIRTHCDKIIVSIFVNPKQFAPNEDLARYPRDFQRDEGLLAERGVDAIFYPTIDIMYPDGYCTYVEVEELGKVLCGQSRPDHFRGVTTVVAKLFNLTKCDIAAFGQKDYQQSHIISKMVKDLNIDLKLLICPIVREADGLAMSSRNIYLNPEERKNALYLHRAIRKARTLFENGVRDAQQLSQEMHREIGQTSGIKIDYLEIVDAETLQPVGIIDKKVVATGAIFVGKTRLIDNEILNP
jgi:pantoate--beta-alanine ligase